MNSYNRKVPPESFCNHEYPYVSRIAEFVFKRINIFELKVTVADKAVHSLPNHAKSLLYCLFKRPADRHHFADAFHTRTDLLCNTFELAKVPARNFTNDIIQCRFKTGSGSFSNCILQFVQAIAQSKFRRNKGKRVSRSF